MPKVQVIVDVGCKNEVATFSEWLQRWRASATISENDGCGCCVDIWDVDGPREAIDVIPEHSQSASDWATPRS